MTDELDTFASRYGRQLSDEEGGTVRSFTCLCRPGTDVPPPPIVYDPDNNDQLVVIRTSPDGSAPYRGKWNLDEWRWMNPPGVSQGYGTPVKCRDSWEGLDPPAEMGTLAPYPGKKPWWLN